MYEDKIKEISLLSLEQFHKLPREIVAIDECYWLRDPATAYEAASGKFINAMIADNDGELYFSGEFVDSSYNGVRPILVLDVPGEGFSLYDSLEIHHFTWKVIEISHDEITVLCDTVIGRNIFNKYPKDYFDFCYHEGDKYYQVHFNNFEGSYIQNALKEWLQDPTKKMEYYGTDSIEEMKKDIDDQFRNMSKELGTELTDRCTELLLQKKCSGNEVFDFLFHQIRWLEQSVKIEIELFVRGKQENRTD